MVTKTRLYCPLICYCIAITLTGTAITLLCWDADKTQTQRYNDATELEQKRVQRLIDENTWYLDYCHVLVTEESDTLCSISANSTLCNMPISETLPKINYPCHGFHMIIDDPFCYSNKACNKISFVIPTNKTFTPDKIQNMAYIPVTMFITIGLLLFICETSSFYVMFKKTQDYLNV